MKNFWDFCAPFYDLAEKANGRAYGKMLAMVSGFVPEGASVLEAAAGTGSISLAAAEKASSVLCTDVSDKMLKRARRKAYKRGVKNITIENQSIFDIKAPDNFFDIVIAGQVLHLIDEPEKAAAELKRVAKSAVILPMSLTKNLRGAARLNFSFYRLFGFAPKIEFSADEYVAFLPSIGFENCLSEQIEGKIPMVVAVWYKK
jgi:ubiquinone/menaquinone biosynthesis C-methylase UbiE